jgi:hypothetical protein
MLDYLLSFNGSNSVITAPSASQWLQYILTIKANEVMLVVPQQVCSRTYIVLLVTAKKDCGHSSACIHSGSAAN